jgi:hypothetical protein
MNDLYNYIRLNTSNHSDPNNFVGEWFNISIRPDFASNEIVNIGVAFEHESKIYSKFLDDFSSINSSFGEAAEDEIQFMGKVARSALEAGGKISPAPSIVFCEPKFARGNNVNEILERLYNSTIKLALPPKKEAHQKTKFLNNTHARQMTFDEMRKKAGVIAERIISENHIYNFQKAFLDIPLLSNKLIGTIVSAGFSKPESVELALLKAYIDLMTASFGGEEKRKRKGFFVLKPKEIDKQFEKSKVRKIDNIIDMIDWKLKKQNITLTIENSAKKLSEKILADSCL